MARVGMSQSARHLIMAILVAAPGPKPLHPGLREGLQLRAMRSSPPGRANKGQRKTVFCSALEQSEQLLTAASQSPPEVRPMLVFYGLAQGVRALFACAPTIDDRDFRTKSHGLREKRLRGSILEMAVEADGHGMFGALCDLLGFNKFAEPVTFAQLWAGQPNINQPLLPMSTAPSCVSASCVPDTTVKPDVNIIRLGFLHRELTDHLDGPLDVTAYVQEHYGPFPFEVFPVDLESSYESLSFDEKWTKLSVHCQQSDFSKVLAHIRAREAQVGYHHLVLPRLGGVWSKPDPLVLLYALLFSLSIRARYEPEGWTKDLDPDTSPHAVYLEEFLEGAPARSYSLLLQTILTICS